MKKYLAVLLAVFFLAPAYAGTVSGAEEDTRLLQRIDRNLNPEFYESYRKLINIEPDGRKKEFILYTVKKDADKVAALFLEPASEKGRSTLRLGDNMWLFLSMSQPYSAASRNESMFGINVRVNTSSLNSRFLILAMIITDLYPL